MIKDNTKTGNFPFDLDLSNLDTGSITNILNDIEQHLPLMESEGDLSQLLKVKAFFEDELKVSHRLHEPLHLPLINRLGDDRVQPTSCRIGLARRWL